MPARSRSRLSLALALAALTAVTAASAGSSALAAHPRRPPWVRHVRHYSGGISNGVRERLAAASGELTVPTKLATHAGGDPSLENVQMNEDSTPPLPQDEPAVALNVEHPMNAVAASNDYTGDGLWIGTTTDGGRHWTSQWKDPKFSFDGGRCYGGDPTVVYSLRDHAFYMGTLCYFTTSPASEIQVWKSTDGGATWSDSTAPSLVVTNRSASGEIDGSVFNDKELMAVDNDPSSPHFGRLYVTYTTFHMTGGSYARSDYCPIRSAYTDRIPTADPSASTWRNVAVTPDAPGDDGRGASANQFSTPIVDGRHALDVAFVSEDCNTSFDRALWLARSTDGGATFGSPVRVDAPGEFADNPNRQDQLPGKGHVRLPATISLTWDATRHQLVLIYQNNADRTVSGADISMQRSRDYGATWDAPRPIAVTRAGAAAPGDQFFPAIGVDGAGTYFAIWQDTRNDPNSTMIETFQGVSTDGGDTWTNRRISEASFNPKKSFFTCGCFIGDYNQIAVSNQVIYPTWTDGRDSPPKPMGDTNVWTDVEIRG
jgi:hypothetical protein